MKIATVVGARPQFIKAAVVSTEIARHPSVREVIIHTGQHFDANMSAVFFDELGMPTPHYDLGIHGGGHGDMTGRMLGSLEQVFLAERPDVVLIYGDTNSTLAGAIAAVKLHIPVGHVEAGLRSMDMRRPEEVNRVLSDRVSRWLFAPSATAVVNLEREGIEPFTIVRVGDVMFDAANYYGERTDNRCDGALRRLGLCKGEFGLVTVHRPGNTDVVDRLRVIVDAFERISGELALVWPLHPRTRGALVREGLLQRLPPTVRVIDPIGYLDMVELERAAGIVITDSGGVQKESFYHGVPCVVLDDRTPWPELVQAGWNHLAPPRDAAVLADLVLRQAGKAGAAIRPYGDGDAAHKIVNTLLSS